MFRLHLIQFDKMTAVWYCKSVRKSKPVQIYDSARHHLFTVLVCEISSFDIPTYIIYTHNTHTYTYIVHTMDVCIAHISVSVIWLLGIIFYISVLSNMHIVL